MDRSHASSAITTPVRPGSPDGEAITPLPERNPNPFLSYSNSPYASNLQSARGSSTGVNSLRPRYFQSRRIDKNAVERPWLDKKNRDPREKWVWILPLIGIFAGLALSGFLIYDGLHALTNHVYCPVLDADFTAGATLDPKVWQQEVETGGFGNGQFEITTNDGENAFVKDGLLQIHPTLQDQKLIDTNNVINLTATKQCTSNIVSDCVAVTNTTNGTIVNPVKSARINTSPGAKIKYGRVEVVAQLPAGDWLWPAIWMLPVNNTYGPWPASGEIDIMESRGNNYTYAEGGNNIVDSTLHFGPDPSEDGWWTNIVKRHAKLTTFSAGYHTYGVEWSEKYIFTYIDTRLLQVIYTEFNMPFWNRGQFPPSNENGTRLANPWDGPGTSDATPFDQDFYLIINVAVGANNGWFTDGIGGKPWVDKSPTAARDFWNAQDQWLPTWQQGGATLNIKSVKMWQQKGYNGC
ncbi:MAG: hypothetical protein M1821_008323 [Bathelium mastoideum]|nr:MAG: hypothetical protein M1821_008323 [Bathelium mastoideum]KAI9693361.1 MAG: hypothetical protein M1822_005357 [Bathelium mastoideum]